MRVELRHHELELNKDGHPDEAHSIIRLGKDGPMICLEVDEDPQHPEPMFVELGPDEAKELIALLVKLL
jgi:hypothetical protein